MTVLSASNVTIRTPGGEPLLSDISLELGGGETVLLAGPSGSGKTLLGKALGGLLDSGSSLEMTGTVARHGSVGFLFQNPRTQLVRRDVRQDIAFGLENEGVPPESIDATIREWADRLDGTHLLKRGIDELSRGETAVVALLGTLVTDPDLVILDEPLAPLDDRNRRLVLSVLEELRASETTLLVAEHDTRDLLERVDRALLIQDGQFRERGHPRDVVGSLREAGVRIPFETEVALERGTDIDGLPLGTGPNP